MSGHPSPEASQATQAMAEPTILIMAGGTGGHVFPGLAVAEVLRARRWQVVWMGNPAGMEASLVPRHGIPLRPVSIGGVRGKGWLTWVLLPLNLARACWQSLRALRDLRPSVVLGMGGYVAFPGGLMAALTRTPLVLHEQNSVAGLTNRLLARLARIVLVAFPGALPRARWCGNPVRDDVLALPEPAVRYSARRGPLRVLVVGGSLGAQALNAVLPRALARMAPAERPQVLHQSGRRHLEALSQAYQEAGVDAQVTGFIDDMAAAYGEADLVICRAGAMTVSEVAAAGVASLMVPFPHAVDDHQTGNARFLADRGAALLMPQSELTPERLADQISSMTRAHLQSMAESARRLSRPDAALEVAQACESLVRRPAASMSGTVS
jgi:UDP-N-acetylglucosamine--N-acetylmuramyl-(pentapeptide) pyrophosphoryl-undecaprenol N-acetylglucosamine transferase